MVANMPGGEKESQNNSVVIMCSKVERRLFGVKRKRKKLDL